MPAKGQLEQCHKDGFAIVEELFGGEEAARVFALSAVGKTRWRPGQGNRQGANAGDAVVTLEGRNHFLVPGLVDRSLPHESSLRFRYCPRSPPRNKLRRKGPFLKR